MLLGQYTHNLLGNSSGLIWSTFNIAGILNCHLNLTPIYVVGKERMWRKENEKYISSYSLEDHIYGCKDKVC